MQSGLIVPLSQGMSKEHALLAGGYRKCRSRPVAWLGNKALATDGSFGGTAVDVIDE